MITSLDHLAFALQLVKLGHSKYDRAIYSTMCLTFSCAFEFLSRKGGPTCPVCPTTWQGKETSCRDRIEKLVELGVRLSASAE